MICYDIIGIPWFDMVMLQYCIRWFDVIWEGVNTQTYIYNDMIPADIMWHDKNTMWYAIWPSHIAKYNIRSYIQHEVNHWTRLQRNVSARGIPDIICLSWCIHCGVTWIKSLKLEEIWKNTWHIADFFRKNVVDVCYVDVRFLVVSWNGGTPTSHLF